ncbi:MAG: RagB/SusD family nutrient uptake outer membrane protein [Pedobacter sp.]|uniref:RagB/SusD family nutrient uptake outer membrane protein n=1 Tax=Pedobacter sp. TaxID=1411316 RepID=UPI0035656078
MTFKNIKIYFCLTGLLLLFCTSCKKLISIPDPVDTTTTNKVFATDNQATSAMAGVYSIMINSTSVGASAYSSFSSGYSTVLGGVSSDELKTLTVDLFGTNKLTRDNSPVVLWTSAYKAIYGVNDVIEGIEASTSQGLTAKARKRLTGEAKFIRAFTYFYLVNFFGDVPLVLTVDFNQTVQMQRMPSAEVYKQIIKDLEEAKALLGTDFSNSKTGERIIPNKWAATAMLARVYLYTGDYTNAAAQAGEVIDQAGLFQLKEDLNEVFLMNSTEAIWQLQQNDPSAIKGRSTPEGFTLLPDVSLGSIYPLRFTDELLQVFENDDKRLKDWTITYMRDGEKAYVPYKYKKGGDQISKDSPITEYYMVLRLAEQYLIRAEARTLNGGPLGLAIDDLNVIRRRAGVENLPATLSRAEVIAAIEKERRTELFVEWGHRWFDLKRTGRAHDVLSAIPAKQPWAGDYQLLYPIPLTEISANNKLSQNPGY